MADPTTALSILAPEVRTLARPDSGVLLSARGLVQRSEEVRRLFLQAKAEGWGSGQLAEALVERFESELEGGAASLHEAALYLADEYAQLGDALLLVSRETGRVLARVTEADLWQPPEVRRESGALAKPLPRLRPELEAFLYQHVHEHDREARLSSDLALRTRQTEFLAAEGDRRLNVATRAGRRAIEVEVQSKGPALLASTSNAAQEFLRLFASEPTATMTLALSGIAMTRVQTQIPDVHAMNYRFDHAAGIHAALAQGLVRELAFAVAVEAHRQKPPSTVSFNEVTAADLNGATFWVCDPQVWAAFMRVPGVTVFHVPGVPPTGFVAPAGAFAMEAGSLKVEGREVFERWDVMGRFSYTVHLDGSAIRTLALSDVPVPSVAAEVVR